ncbi:MAG: ferredoxin [Rhodobacteraceae bacterium]|nr:ferredoxin [Paracoccaceae bacterium]PHR61752.1 MAG: ferredoxin [Robiginitomaculum sp.]
MTIADWEQIDAALTGSALMISGVAPLRPEDNLPPHLRSVILLSPDEPGFWPQYSASAEANDGAPDPIDRWSTRVITALANELNAQAIFPFGGPPWAPFQRWAQASGRAWVSPVGMLVHDVSGLFISFRGALALPQAAPNLRPGRSPCKRCAAQPCKTACPTEALTNMGYDLASCHAYLDTVPGVDCLSQGCAVRRACPVGQANRLTAHSAHHMKAFHAP